MQIKKKSLLIGISLIVVLSGLCGYGLGRYTTNENKQLDKVYVKYDENFSKLNIENYDGKKVKFSQSKERNQLVLYLDSKCGSCYRQLEVVERLEKIWGEWIDVSVLWEGKIPKDKIKSYQISNKQIFSLPDQGIITDRPACFLLDSKGKVIFVTTEMKKIVDKLTALEGVDKEKLLKNSDEYLKNLFPDKNGKQQMIYFSMEGCKDCKAADKVIEDKVQKSFEIIKIYEETAYGTEQYVDIDGIFENVYSIDWYPSFLILNNNDKGTFIGNTPIEELESAIMKNLE